MWKPVNLTSFDVVKIIRNQINPVKVGHAGTLDPFAEGLLVLCTGKKTKSIESLMNEEKEYTANLILGTETDTLDPTGGIIKTADVPTLTTQSILGVLSNFIGNIMQEPPMYSALKFNGIPLYKLARKGILIKRNKRVVNIYKICKIVFIPTIYTGGSLPILESMKCGIPVVCSNTGSILEIVKNTALTCDPFDINSYVKNITSLLNDKKLYF